jgi:hypothetical protein
MGLQGEQELRERNRLAQVRYRERHREALRRARLVASALVRPSVNIGEVADALAACCTESALAELRKALTPAAIRRREEERKAEERTRARRRRRLAASL